MTVCSVTACDRPVRTRGWCHAHYVRWWQSGEVPTTPITPKGRPDSDRFWEKVDAYGDCWVWQAGRSTDGYGVFRWGGRSGTAHRFAWTTLVGPIPDHLESDHLCRNKLCVNPDHIELVTKAENARRSPLGGITLTHRRKTHCINGHEFVGANLYIRPGGGRRCRQCDRDRYITKKGKQ